MNAENLTWISEPSQPYDKKYDQWPQWTYWDYTIKSCDTKFTMGIEEHEVYLAEKELLEHVFPLGREYQVKLIKLIEAYGRKREEKGRSDVQKDWAEAEAGAGV